MISFGVPFGATTPRSSAKLISMPRSLSVGVLGSWGSRSSLAIASALIVPASRCFLPDATLTAPSVIAPESKAFMRSAVPS